MRLSRHKLFLPLALLASAAGFLANAESAVPDSPFLSASPTATDPHARSNEPYQLSAIGVVEGKTYVSIYDAAEKRSRWIAVGGRLGDLQVVSCDIDAEQAVIRAGGQLKTLTLPKAAVTTAAASAGAETAATGAPAAATAGNSDAATTALTDEEKAREARMLVSDLLEIGMQQRKAYEDAQRKAAEQPAKSPAVN